MLEWIYDLTNGTSEPQETVRVGNSINTLKGNLVLLKEAMRVSVRRRRKPVAPDSTFVPLAVAANLSGFSRNTMKRYATEEACRIVYTKIKGTWWIERKSLMDFLERIKVKPVTKRGRPGRPRFYDE